MGERRRSPRTMGQRRIVVLIDNIESDYQLEMLSGVLRATRTSSVNTLIVAGGRLSDGITRSYLSHALPSHRMGGGR